MAARLRLARALDLSRQPISANLLDQFTLALFVFPEVIRVDLKHQSSPLPNDGESPPFAMVFLNAA
ncbi:MAG: hypothetical protein IAE89_02190 [Anaerolineae bacterium]|nr:hypothetical protein [Anaerolineae bacterium]